MVRLAALLVMLISASSWADTPQRVVSINLCTDQLAMLIGAPGQLVSISPLAANPVESLMAEEAARIPANHGLAEEVYLLQPDLVLAGTYGARATVDMLRRLGVRVETLAPAMSIAEVRDNIIWTGAQMGQPRRAARVLADFDAALDALPRGNGTEAVSFAANGWTAGRHTLAGDVMRAAGLDLPADAMGLEWGGEMPLEQLVLAHPDLIVTATRYAHPSRAEEILDHPAMAAIDSARIEVPDRDWICGLPHLAQVAAGLVQ